MKTVGIEESFIKIYPGRRPEFTADAGGSIFLMGDQAEYHDGIAIAAAVDLRSSAAGVRRGDGLLRIFSLNEDAAMETRIDGIKPPQGKADWRSALTGPVWAMRKSRWNVTGMDLLVRGNAFQSGETPFSASTHVALVGLCSALAGAGISAIETARIAKLSMQGFCGIRGGMVGTMAGACCERQCVMMVDCRSAAVEQVRFPAEWAIVLADSGARPRISPADRETRNSRVSSGILKMKAAYPNVNTPRDVNRQMLETTRKSLGSDEHRLLDHLVSENARCLDAREAIKCGDSGRIGKIMTESHQSVARNFESSCPEIDALVEAAGGSPGFIGSRTTGEDTWGCTVNLIMAAKAAEFRTSLEENYLWKTRKRAVTRIVACSEGLNVRAVL
jgi:galactokinase